MRSVFNGGPLKEYRNKRRIERIFLLKQLIFRYYNTLTAGLHQVTELEMGVTLRVADGEN